MGKNRFTKWLVTGILLSLFFGIALYLRIALPYDKVFVGDWIKITTPDAFYFMRQVDNLVRNFPHAMSFDPYLLYPGGQSLGSPSLFIYLLGGIAWLIGFGSPTPHTIDMVGIYLPAILAALAIIPVYFIGKELFNRWAGVIAAGLLAIFPGEFLGRSILGSTDRDALEVLLTALTMLFLILAIKSTKQKEIGLNLRQLGRTMVKPLAYSLLTGICLGLYLLTWRGAFLFVFIIFAYLIIQAIIDHLRHININYLAFIGTITFLVALIIFLPSNPGQARLASLLIAVITPPVLAAISWLMSKTSLKVGYYPLALFGLGLVGLGIIYVVNPSILKSVLNQLDIFALSETEATISEMKPILFPYDKFSLSAVWANFTTGFFLSLISIGILIYLVIKRGEANKTLMLVWSLVILIATLALRRLAVIFTINVAILSGYLAWLMLDFAGLKETPDTATEAPQKAVAKVEKKKKKHKHSDSTSPNWLNIGLAIVIVFFLFFFPNFTLAQNAAKNPSFAPSDGWCESLSWMKDNTPDPFGDPDFYYASYTTPFRYPETAYGVTAWWDYGYFITRMAHRLPNCNPGGNEAVRQRVASLFTTQDEASAAPIISELKSRYVIIDFSTADLEIAYNAIDKSFVVQSKFGAIATYAGSSAEKFYEVYYQPKNESFVVLFYPEYYRSLAVRLYNFNGERVSPEDIIVVNYAEQLSSEGTAYKQIIESRTFPSYKEAQDYVNSQTSGNYRIGGGNPYLSPVPLEKLEHYKLVYSSQYAKTQPSTGTIPEVKIFECIE